MLSFLLFHFILQKLPLFDGDGDGDEGLGEDRYSILIALILAFFVAYFLTTQPAYQNIFIGYFGRVSIAVIGLLGLMLLLAFAGVSTDKAIPLVVILSILAITAAFAISGGFGPFIPGGSLPGLDITYEQIADLFFDSGLIYLLIIGGAIWWLFASTDDSDDSSVLKTLVEGNI